MGGVGGYQAIVPLSHCAFEPLDLVPNLPNVLRHLWVRTNVTSCKPIVPSLSLPEIGWRGIDLDMGPKFTKCFAICGCVPILPIASQLCQYA